MTRRDLYTMPRTPSGPEVADSDLERSMETDAQLRAQPDTPDTSLFYPCVGGGGPVSLLR